MFYKFAKKQERHCGGIFVCIFGKYTTSEPRCHSGCECQPRCASNGTECHASNSARRLHRIDHQVFRLSLGGGRDGLHSIQCDAAARLEWQEFCADAPCPCGPSVTTPSSCTREGGGATMAMPTSPPDPHGTTDLGTSASAPSGRSPSVRAFFF